MCDDADIESIRQSIGKRRRRGDCLSVRLFDGDDVGVGAGYGCNGVLERNGPKRVAMITMQECSSRPEQRKKSYPCTRLAVMSPTTIGQADRPAGCSTLVALSRELERLDGVNLSGTLAGVAERRIDKRS